ncbi:uncharacterized protein LOC128799603 isoform X6 [Vidua chalybeata]|uniref:uncharacterized protein LOC128799603 isoform X6 n=1 Tax=Vidua chalybeata TaxID=81927 RepID=UPI0023A7F6EF|nr:uncharacterized protein LOC128799603 isoform X6 [Vidua chalybeata]XP_053820121.1 uncharacterized protein LOC128799603 isoform X6 [Vidua chalybeata]
MVRSLTDTDAFPRITVDALGLGNTISPMRCFSRITASVIAPVSLARALPAMTMLALRINPVKSRKRSWDASKKTPASPCTAAPRSAAGPTVPNPTVSQPWVPHAGHGVTHTSTPSTALTLTYKEPAPTSWPNPMGTTLGCCPSGSRPRMTSVVGSNLCPISPWSMLTSMDNTSPSTGMKMAESGVNREVMLLPVLLADGKVRVRPTGLRVVLDTDFGLRVSYYWNWHPRSTSPAATSAKSVASAGISTSSPLMISPRLVYHCNYHMGQIWKSADSEVNHWICWGYCDGPCPVCDEEKKELYGGNHYCGIIKKSFQGPFRA